MVKGKLKIFFSYAPGIGKTNAMLKAALEEKEKGRDVVVGYISMKASADVLFLTQKLEVLGGSFDLDKALSRKPELLILDELAHTNSEEARHKRRYQDVQELLDQGINVYTTVNLGNIESLHDIVVTITQYDEIERIPDTVFDGADQVELVDVETEELIERFEEYSINREQLMALRELALRRCADRIKRLANNLYDKRTFNTEEHILACLSSAPSNARIIRTAARMANAFNSRFTALFVETPSFSRASQEDVDRLKNNMKLAQSLGATIEMVYGEDVPYQIAEFARVSEVTKIVLGRSSLAPRGLFSKSTITEKLIQYVPQLDIHIIPDQLNDNGYRPKVVTTINKKEVLLDCIKSVLILIGASLLGTVFYHLGYSDSNIIMVYILGVLLTSIVTSHQLYSLVSSVSSVFIFNYLFIAPRFTLDAYDAGSPVTFAVMFLTAYISGTQALRYKKQAGQSAKVAYRTSILFETEQLLVKAKDKLEIIQATGAQLLKLLKRNVVIFDENVQIRYLSGQNKEEDFDATEMNAVNWVFKNNRSAGATTDTLSQAKYLYLANRVNEQVYGVTGIELDGDSLDAFEHSILISILGEMALALENEKNNREKEAAAILAESEQLRANLLRTISHDLRTPLTTIIGNASNLLSHEDSFDKVTRQTLYKDIYEDAQWLIHLVENLLYATRIEEGRMTLQTSTELASDLISEAIKHVENKLEGHKLIYHESDDLLLVKADGNLIVQVIVNLFTNAIKYTPEGTAIEVGTVKEKDYVSIEVADHGYGLSDEEKVRIFDKFYSGNHPIVDHRRSLGLGLYLCKSIVEAHGGTIKVRDNIPQGAIFSFTLPLEEVKSYE